MTLDWKEQRQLQREAGGVEIMQKSSLRFKNLFGELEELPEKEPQGEPHVKWLVQE
jgi:hypothetical protein